jgi:hypothetical protein
MAKMGPNSAATIARVAGYSFGSIYQNYVTKVERKGQSIADLRRVIEWLTGYDDASLDAAVSEGITMGEFFEDAPAMNANAELIKGVICGVRVEEIEDPFMKQVRQLDKLVDEVAKGKKMASILRQ